jgi:hypothetical protein
MDRVGAEVRRELERFGPQAGMSVLLERWPAAVGAQIARNAWPARIARDGTVHVHTSDAIWAFELGHRAAEIAGRLGVPALRFAAGPLPEPAPEGGETSRAALLEPSPQDVERGTAVAAAVADAELRDRIARAVALGLARAAADRSF